MKDLKQRELGFLPVNVVTHSMRWGNDSHDIKSDTDTYHKTYHTTFELLTKMSKTKHLNAVDVLGLSITAPNEMM